MPNSGKFEEEPLVGGDPEQGGFTNPNIPQNEIDAAMDNEDAASMISGGDLGTAEVMEKGTEGNAQTMSETLKQVTTIPEPFEKKGAAAAKTSEAKKDEGGFGLMSMVIVVAFIVADCGKVLFEGLSGTGESSFNMAAFLAFVAFLNIVGSFTATVVLSGKEGVKTAFGSSLFLFVLPSLMFSASQLLTILQNAEISSDLRKVFQQLRIPTTALFSKFVMGHGYTTMQWYLICGVVLCVFSFQIAANKSGVLFDLTDTTNNIGAGLFLAIVSNIFAALGSLMAEKYCKEAAKTPFYIQKFQIELWGFAAGIINILILNPTVAWTGDMLFDGTLGKRFNGANPLMHKTMQFTHGPFATSRPWSTDALPSTGKPKKFGNMYDTLSWESKWDQTMETYAAGQKEFVKVELPPMYQQAFDEAQYQQLIELVATIAKEQKARADGELDLTKGSVGEFSARASGSGFASLVTDKSAPWKKIAEEGKFIVGHGFHPMKRGKMVEDIVSSFGFTWGKQNGDDFQSMGPAQRQSPRLNSWWLTKVAESEAVKASANKDAAGLFTAPATPYFTHSKRIVQADIAAEMKQSGADKEKMGSKKPILAAGQETFGIQTITFEKSAVYDPAAKTVHLIFAKNTERKFSAAAAAITCKQANEKLVLPLTCPEELHYGEKSDLEAKDTKDCVLGAAKWVAGDKEEKCEFAFTAHKDCCDVEAEKAFRKAEKEKATAKEAAKKAKSADENAVEAADKAMKLVKTVKGEAVATKGWMETNAYDFVGLPAEGKYQTWAYPGSDGAGSYDAKTKKFVCDKQMCEMSDTVWDANYGYMSNNWKNRPANPTGEDTRNPFHWGEMHSYTRFVMPLPIWTKYAVLALASNIAQSWLSGLLAKSLSSLWKNLCQAVALALVVLLQKFTTEVTSRPQTIGLIGGPKWVESIVGMLTVLCIVWTFSQAPKAPKKH